MGDRIKPNWLTVTFPDSVEKHGLPRMRFHDLRHSCASLLLANGVPLKQIQEWLGHSDFSTTANIYAHLDYTSKLYSAQAMVDGIALPQADHFGSRWDRIAEKGRKSHIVLSKLLERTARKEGKNRVKDKKEKSRNPHGYWIFRWRRRWDSNPRDLAVYLISSQARYDHFDTPPCVFFARFFLFFAAGSETTLERTDGKNYGIFNFRAREKPHGYGLCAIRSAQSQRRFRASEKNFGLENGIRSVPLYAVFCICDGFRS